MTPVQSQTAQIAQQFLAQHPECLERLRGPDWSAAHFRILRHVIGTYARDNVGWREWEMTLRPQIIEAVRAMCERERTTGG